MYRNGGSNELNVSAWDDKPFEMLPSGNKAYLDEQDVVTFLDPPKDLIPFDPSSYNPAAYLWYHYLLCFLQLFQCNATSLTLLLQEKN